MANAANMVFMLVRQATSVRSLVDVVSIATPSTTEYRGQLGNALSACSRISIALWGHECVLTCHECVLTCHFLGYSQALKPLASQKANYFCVVPPPANIPRHDAL